jgi:NitT/TauT family transport system substrate-binding protein
MTVIRSHLLATLALLGAATAHAENLPVWHDGTVSPAADAGIIFMASKNGFDRRNGLVIDMVTFKGDPIMLKALLGGQLDSYEGGPGSPMVAASKGADTRVMACHWPKQNFSLWARGSVHTLRDLQGKTLGVSAPGSAPDLFVRAALAEQNIPASTVQLVSIGTPPEILRSIGAGVVDSGALNNELDIRAAKLGLTEITDSDKVSPLAIRRCFETTATVLHNKADLAARFLAAEMEAYAYALSHRDEVLALTRSITHLPVDAPEPEAAFDDVIKRQTVTLDFGVPMDRLDYLKSTLVASGQLPASFDPASMVDTTALQKARTMKVASP